MALLSVLLSGFNKDKLTPDEAREIAQQAFVFGLPPVYLSLQADFLSNAPKPEAMRAPGAAGTSFQASMSCTIQ